MIKKVTKRRKERRVRGGIYGEEEKEISGTK